MKERCYIGIDSGGSHCKGVLVTESGRCLGTSEAGPCSVTGTPFDTACENLKTVILALISLCNEDQEISGLFAGISGCGVAEDAARFDAFLHQEFPELPSAKTGSDALNPLYACIGDQDGIIAICGTGSGAYARIRGDMHRVDLDGYLFGDEAGGFAIGRHVINSALRMQDGRMKKTLLYDLCAAKMNGDVRAHLQTAYAGGKQYVATFAPVAFEAMMSGDEIGKSIIDQAVDSITEDILAASVHFPSETERITVVACGSLWKPADRYFEKAVTRRIGPGFEIRTPDLDPAFGAAVYAAALTGLENTEKMLENIQK